MKRFTLLICAAFLPGCLTTIERHEFACSDSGQYYEGFTVTGTKNSANVGHVRCRTPENKREKCYVEGFSKLSSIAQNHNSTAKTRNMVIGVGYGIWFVPGYLAKSYWEEENEASIRNFVEQERSVKDSCDDLVAHFLGGPQ